MADSPTYRLPIRASGFIEVRAEYPPKVIIDQYDWEYAPWPRVNGNGYEETVVQVEVTEDGKTTWTLEADSDIVDAIRNKAEKYMDSAHWQISKRVEQDVLGRDDD